MTLLAKSLLETHGFPRKVVKNIAKSANSMGGLIGINMMNGNIIELDVPMSCLITGGLCMQ